MSAPTPPFAFDGVVRLTRIGTTLRHLHDRHRLRRVEHRQQRALHRADVPPRLPAAVGHRVEGRAEAPRASSSTASRKPWAGRPAHGRLRVRNRSRIWNVRDVVISPTTRRAALHPAASARRSEIGRARRVLVPPARTRRTQPLDLYTRYPFGFFLKKRRIRITGDVIVFPRLLRTTLSASASGRRQRRLQISANRVGGGTEIHSFRDYVRGDSLRQVHWKKSASARPLDHQADRGRGRAARCTSSSIRIGRAASARRSFEEMISEAATFLYTRCSADWRSCSRCRTSRCDPTATATAYAMFPRARARSNRRTSRSTSPHRARHGHLVRGQSRSERHDAARRELELLFLTDLRGRAAVLRRRRSARCRSSCFTPCMAGIMLRVACGKSAGTRSRRGHARVSPSRTSRSTSSTPR